MGVLVCPPGSILVKEGTFQTKIFYIFCHLQQDWFLWEDLDKDDDSRKLSLEHLQMAFMVLAAGEGRGERRQDRIQEPARLTLTIHI